MRPRFMNRGSESHERQRGEVVQASMRPRFMNRGSRGYDGDRKITSGLQ